LESICCGHGATVAVLTSRSNKKKSFLSELCTLRAL
jgi:hypothetical protein